MSLSVHFVNVSCQKNFEWNNATCAETSDPLQGIGNDVEPKCQRINTVVFCEPLDIKGKADNLDNVQDEIVTIDNVVVQKRSGMKYKKYHINMEDTSDLSCPQFFVLDKLQSQVLHN
ncbi:uncharacterized protein LOC142984318 [Anticarsia gemmatalis]|uniref:uncharacterized protein LOC142984318 n=1 Tax=Anticarsia gemmatalis TaxID=129554 RepID=UPI003F76F286